MSLGEPKIRKSIMKFLKNEGYLVIKEFELDGRKADIAAFKWKNDYEIESIAVECKGGTKNINTFIEAAWKQAREYQIAFPHVYLGIPAIEKLKLEDLINAIKRLRIGVFTVDDNESVKKEAADFSLRLKEKDYFLKVRQRAAALWSFKESTKKDEDEITEEYNPYGIACWTKGKVNYLITNGDIQADKNYHFGVNVEKIKNIKSDPEKLYRIIRNLPDEYILRIDYNYKDKPRAVYHPILIKRVNEIDIKDIKWMINYSKELEGKKLGAIRIFISKKVWNLYEALRKDEHLRRIEKVINETEELRNLHE